MICLVDLADELSALRAVRIGDHAKPELLSKAAVERAMKVQKVMLRALAKKITWFQAAEILGISHDICGDGGSGMSSLDLRVCCAGGAACPSPERISENPWRL